MNRIITFGVVSAVLLAGVNIAHADDPPAPTTQEIKEALADVPGLLQTSDKTKVSTDPGSAAITSAAGTLVDAPLDAEESVDFVFDDGADLTVDLPNSDEAQAGVRVARGIVAYPSQEGATNVVQAEEHGGVRMMTIITGREAPTKYTYDLNLPSGSSILQDAHSNLTVTTPSGQLSLGAPWAKDANGRAVPVRYTTDGKSRISLHVSHRRSGIAYPVVADPFWIPIVVIRALIKCGVGAYIGWISSGGYRWWERALAIAGGCLLAILK
jgi:hypothetical protein